jgi:EAL domain-containing protein (putative c-di-GMP-specific phosphodiesterase class I)
VPLSGSHLSNPRFAAEFADTVRRECVAPGSLMVQFAEQVLLDHTDAASALFRDLHAMGTRIQLDRFGAGSAPLLFLRRFAIDSLKLDRTWVRMLADETDREVLAAVVTLTHKLGMRVVADDIQSASQFEKLRDLGCDFGQSEQFATFHPTGEQRAVLPLVMDT